MTVIRHGGCACGQLRFEVLGEPTRVGLCHCLTCRKASGSILNAYAVYPGERVRVTGEVRRWTADTPGADARGHCPTCGGQVLAGYPGGEVEIRLGALDETSSLAPTHELFVGRREDWFACARPLLTYVEGRDGATAVEPPR